MPSTSKVSWFSIPPDGSLLIRLEYTFCRRYHATLINGKSIAKKILEKLSIEASTFEKKYKRRVVLTCVLIGDRAESMIYVKNKVIACEKVGKDLFFSQYSRNFFYELFLAVTFFFRSRHWNKFINVAVQRFETWSRNSDSQTKWSCECGRNSIAGMYERVFEVVSTLIIK